MFLLLFLSALICACEDISDSYYYVNNESDKEINIIMIGLYDNYIYTTVPPFADSLIHNSQGMFNAKNDKLTDFFSKITLVFNGDTSNINFVNEKLWDKIVISKHHVEWHLTINEAIFN